MSKFILKGKEYRRWRRYRQDEASSFVHIWAHLSPYLNVDIGLDDDGYHKYFHHPLWIYFKNSYETDSREWLPLIVDGTECYIPLPEYHLHISEEDFREIVSFAGYYSKLIKRLADSEMNFGLFCGYLEAIFASAPAVWKTDNLNSAF